MVKSAVNWLFLTDEPIVYNAFTSQKQATNFDTLACISKFLLILIFDPCSYSLIKHPKKFISYFQHAVTQKSC